MDGELRILMLEDTPSDAELVQHELRAAGVAFTATRVETREDFERELEQFSPDLILSDYSLPGYDGISALATVVLEKPDIPFIFVSGALGEELAIETLKCGATDYILKSKLSRLGPAVVRAMREATERTDRKKAEEELLMSLQQVRKALEDTVRAIATVAERRDPYTAGHQRRVADLAAAIAGELGLPADQIEGIRVAGILHDIGKIAVPAEILTKPSRLTDVEFGIIKTHPAVSNEIIEGIEFPWPVAAIVRQHHERLDGSGYPDGLSGSDILLEARVLAVADVVEAMASHRPYRPARGIDEALDEINNGRGTTFDPAVVDACVRLFRQKGYELPSD